MNFIHDSVRSQLLKPPSMKNQTEKKNYGAVGNVARKRTGSKEFQNFIMGGYADDKKGKKNKQKKIKKHKKKKKNAFDPDEVEKKRLEQKKSKKRDSRKEENGYNAISDDLVQTLNDLDLKGEDCYDGGTLKRNSMDEKEEEGNNTNPNIYEITFNENSVEVQGLICSPAYASSDVSVDDIALIVSPRHYNGFNDLRLDEEGARMSPRHLYSL